LRQAERDISDLRKTGPEPWLYFGDYPDDTFTTFYSPPFENSFARAGAPFTGAKGFPRVRWDENYRLEFAGVVDMGTDGAVMVTLPEDWRPDTDDFFTVAVLTGATPTHAQLYVEASSGDVTVTLL
jgi:hypothetical protein